MSAKLTSAAARLGCAVLALTAAAGLAGCREHARLDDFTARELSNPETRHPIGFAAKPAALFVEVPPGGEGLSPNQAQDVRVFLARYRSESQGRLRIVAPGSARGHMGVSRSMRDIEDLVAEAGIPRQSVETRRSGGEVRSGTMKLAYERPEAIAPACGDWPEDLGHNRERIPHPDFGCPTQRNLAVMVANSRDLQEPQAETPRASELRSAHWSKYSGSSAGGSSGGGGAPAPAGGAPNPSGGGGAPKP